MVPVFFDHLVFRNKILQQSIKLQSSETDSLSSLDRHVSCLLPEVAAHNGLRVTANMLSGAVASYKWKRKAVRLNMIGIDRSLHSVSKLISKCRFRRDWHTVDGEVPWSSVPKTTTDSDNKQY